MNTNATKVNNVSMAIEIIDGAENVRQLLDAVEAIQPAAKVAAYRRFYSPDGEKNVLHIKSIIGAIEQKHEELLQDIFNAEEDDLKLVRKLRALSEFVK